MFKNYVTRPYRRISTYFGEHQYYVSRYTFSYTGIMLASELLVFGVDKVPRIRWQKLAEPPTLAIVCNHYAPNRHWRRILCTDKLLQVHQPSCLLVVHNSIRSRFFLQINDWVLTINVRNIVYNILNLERTWR